MPRGIFTPKSITGPNGERWSGRGRKPKWMKDQNGQCVAGTATACESTHQAAASQSPAVAMPKK